MATPASQLDICNRALFMLGHSTITAAQLAALSVPQAVYCAQYYDDCRVEALMQHPWSWAVATATLVEATTGTPAVAVTDDESLWSYVYVKPTDLLRPILVNGDPEAEYEIRGDYIFSDTGEAVLRYVADSSTVTDWSVQFCTYLATLLASRIAMQITGSSELMQGMQENARLAYRQALAADVANERLGMDRARTFADARF